MPIPGADAKMEMKKIKSKIRIPIRAFTLTELLLAMVIITILLGLSFPSFQGALNQTRRTQATNDLLQIITAVSAYYTEYGAYPRTGSVTGDTTYGIGTTTNDKLFNELRAVNPIQNPRGIVFFSPADAKDPGKPRSGIGIAPPNFGQYFDPWGKPYLVRLDSDYDNQLENPYAQNAGSTPLRSGVIAWSFGKDGLSQSTITPALDKNTGTNKDDIISW